MSGNDPRPGAARGGHVILRLLASFPIACFSGALLTDLAYVRTTNIMWADFSAWLLAAGMAGGGVAAAAGLVIWLVGRRRNPTPWRVWSVMIGSGLTLVIALFNNFMHSRDAWTSVMPMGLALSLATVLAMLGTAWLAVGSTHPQAAAMPYPRVRP